MFLKDAWNALWHGTLKAQIKYVEVPVYKVVELRAPRVAQAWTKEIKDSVATLSAHPGFIAIVDRLNLQRQMLKDKVAQEFHKDQRETDYQQAGVFWLGFIQDLVAKSTKMPLPQPVDPTEEEMEAFKQLDSMIERIGMETQSPSN